MPIQGPPPKPPSKRRRANIPNSYGLAAPVKGGKAGKQPDLGFEAHEIIASIWTALAASVEGQFFSHADWEKARSVLWYGNLLMSSGKTPSAVAWGTFQTGLNDLLVSPADKRRAGIELERVGDPDEDAAVLQITKYQDALTS